MDQIGGMREAFAVRVDDEVDATLAPQRDILRDVIADMLESEGTQHAAQFRRLGLVGRELDELYPLGADAWRHRYNVDSEIRLGAGHLIHEVEKRAMAVDRDRARRATAELVVEDFERQWAGIAGRRDGAHECRDIEIAFAGHVAEMPAEIEQVHVDARSVGQLDEEDPVAGDRADCLGIDTSRERVEAVDDQANIVMVGAPHDFPGVAMVVDMTAPGKCLVADTDTVSGRALAKLTKIRGGAIDAAEGKRRHVGADEDGIRAKLAHQVELAFSALKCARALRLRHALEIPKRLEQQDFQPVITDHAAHLGGAAVECEKVVLEDLDAVEAGRCDRGELLAQIAADRNGRDGGLHRSSPPSWLTSRGRHRRRSRRRGGRGWRRRSCR